MHLHYSSLDNVGNYSRTSGDNSSLSGCKAGEWLGAVAGAVEVVAVVKTSQSKQAAGVPIMLLSAASGSLYVHLHTFGDG
jgi:hypothetical protein